MDGVFIAFEGVDGCGKSTQVILLHEWMLKKGIDHVVTREPGGVPSADMIRNILSQSGNAWSSMAQALLLNAGRLEHTNYLIRPQLSRGVHVVSDRYVDSTFAYQGGGEEEAFQRLLQLHRLVIGDFFPHVTFWLDIDPLVVQERLKRRARNGVVHDFEKKQAVQMKAQQGYEALSRRFPERIRRINANGLREETFEQIQVHCMDILG